MNSIAGLFARMYARLLSLYPPRFREEFGKEMLAVFTQAIHEAAQSGRAALLLLCLRELFGLPINILREFQHELSGKGMNMDTTNMNETGSGIHARASRGESLLAALPFLIFALYSIASHLAPRQTLMFFLLASLIFLVGLTIGAVRDFPRWAYSFLGWAGVSTLMYGMVRLDQIFPSLPPSTHGIPLGLLGLDPLILAFVIALLWRRSFAPLKSLFRGIWQDWTSLSLALFTFAGFVFLIFDENHHPYLFAFMIASALALCAAVWAYMRSRRTGTRALSLAFGFVGAFVINWVCDNTWDAAGYYGLPPASSQPWLLTFIGTLELTALWAVILFWPALIGLVRRMSGPRLN